MCVALSLATAIPVFAQSPKLRGITQLQLIAENMDDADVSCGLTDAAFKNAVAEPVRDGNIRVVGEGGGDVYLYFRTNTLYLAATDTCVTAWAVDLRRFVEWQADPTADTTTSPAVLQSKGGLLSSARAVHSGRVNDAARAAAREIVAAIRQANQ